MKKNTNGQGGFTLIEILVVIGIIAVLAAIVIVAINPARQFAQARNSQRQSNVETILNAIGQNLADNKGIFTCASIGTAIGTPTASTSVGTASGNSNLGTCLAPTYIAAGIPTDPTNGTALDTGYDVSVDTATGRYTVCAPKGNETNTSVQEDICVAR